jgi:solute carrier family 25 carnitine/acylcarnitine transporter 20/29
MSNSVKTY